MKLSNLSISKRLSLAFGFLILMMVGAVSLGLYDLAEIDHHIEDIVNDNNVKLKLNHEMSESVHIAARVTRTVVLLDDDAAVERELQKIASARKHYDEAWGSLSKFAASDKGKSMRVKIDQAKDSARAASNRVIELAKDHKDKEAISFLMKEAGPATQKWQEAIDENIGYQETANKEAYDATQKAYNKAKMLLILLAVVTVMCAIVMVVMVVRSITGPLGQALSVAQAIAQGDLTRELQTTSKDEMGQLLSALGTMQDNLRNTVRTIKESSDTIETASKEIAIGNTDLSQRTEEQASSLEETASSMEELTSTVKQNAENAKQANQLAASASEIAVKGGDVVGQVVGTMSSINESSKKIVDIISVIDGIAFQTNILALNAAVEAARAGEQGRGFAVVASEVRTLAQRSAAAAKEIKTLIGDSVAKVEDGTKLVDEAGKTMEEIVTSVKRVTDIMAEISAASQEQSSGIEQVNQAVTQMDEVTQQNAALVEEAAAAAESMQEQAQSLTQAVSVFTLTPTGGANQMSAKRAAASTEPTVERRGPDRPKNVARLPAKADPSAKAEPQPRAKTGTDDEWSEF